MSCIELRGLLSVAVIVMDCCGIVIWGKKWLYKSKFQLKLQLKALPFIVCVVCFPPLCVFGLCDWHHYLELLSPGNIAVAREPVRECIIFLEPSLCQYLSLLGPNKHKGTIIMSLFWNKQTNIVAPN